MTKDNLVTLIKSMRAMDELSDVPAHIVYGVVMKESSGNEFACRYEAGYKWLFNPQDCKPTTSTLATEMTLQRCSFGLMQVMGATLRELGFKGWLTEIVAKPDEQIRYGCMYLAKHVKKYGVLELALSAYNAGHPIDSNKQSYVAKVIGYSKEWPEDSTVKER